MSASSAPLRVVVLVSGSGTTLQALLDAGPPTETGYAVVAVGADRPGTGGQERARARGCGRIQLDVNQANQAAVALYESCGFRPLHNPEKWGDSPDFLYTREIT